MKLFVKKDTKIIVTLTSFKSLSRKSSSSGLRAGLFVLKTGSDIASPVSSSTSAIDSSSLSLFLHQNWPKQSLKRLPCHTNAQP